MGSLWLLETLFYIDGLEFSLFLKVCLFLLSSVLYSGAKLCKEMPLDIRNGPQFINIKSLKAFDTDKSGLQPIDHQRLIPPFCE